ncbi:MAG: hypothetical protein UU71_C0016G0015 [Parcubacteria group bacterium GW2011_GWB1_41_6]|nr:MAG: hypothetical protein UU71_C0016G0015 [Parcubacteria group bacterium GW2011_GWB1_41_6]KKS33638.1 MAG: hypothetical protein UU96_C0018G0008 [Parcubacteria group bacterium GW2011_GWC2_42_13]KKS56379.1 MAG: hypothetical protein UV22_C0033G0007 [Parcubacteria group bacterium GW2011_GWA2_42_35]KKS70340.1 MAG: hypothetical protein UV43_C0067G0006 [Parcubacteria group bacterium GW2011_GWF2_42_7]
MDKVTKALKALNEYERKVAKLILEKIIRKDFSNLDIKKLKSREDIFRIRKGKIRIIYRIDKKGEVFILTIERRSDKTYKGL